MGLFLVRESTNYPGDYTLCVSSEGKVEHYRIIYHNGKLTIDEEAYFENLMQLVEVRIVWRCSLDFSGAFYLLKKLFFYIKLSFYSKYKSVTLAV